MLVTDIDHLGSVISHATAPTFMLGAVVNPAREIRIQLATIGLD